MYAVWMTLFAWVGEYLDATSSVDQKISLPHLVAGGLFGLVVARFFDLVSKR